MTIIDCKNFVKFLTGDNFSIVYYNGDDDYDSCIVKYSDIIKLTEFIFDDKALKLKNGVGMNIVFITFQLQREMKKNDLWSYDLDTSQFIFKDCSPEKQKFNYNCIQVNLGKGELYETLYDYEILAVHVLKATAYVKTDDCEVISNGETEGFISLICNEATFPITKEDAKSLINICYKNADYMKLADYIKFINQFVKENKVIIYINHLIYNGHKKLCTHLSYEFSLSKEDEKVNKLITNEKVLKAEIAEYEQQVCLHENDILNQKIQFQEKIDSLQLKLNDCEMIIANRDKKLEAYEKIINEYTKKFTSYDQKVTEQTAHYTIETVNVEQESYHILKTLNVEQVGRFLNEFSKSFNENPFDKNNRVLLKERVNEILKTFH